MAWLIIIGMLCAFGTLCVFWVLLGWILPWEGRYVLVHLCRPGTEAAAVRRYRWLREIGAVHCRLLLADSALPEEEREALAQLCAGVEFCELADLPARIAEERSRFG